ncbi:MAG: PorT family protein [Candidatus Latescibacterota bacterium]|nr:MAG: PorT family protein [Candidatus Latescibacterota bacterium]
MSRKTRLALFSLSLLGACLHAPRVDAIVDVLAGPKFGWTVTTFTGDSDDATKTKNSFVGGAVVAWQVKRWFLVQLEPAFTGKGADLQTPKGFEGATELKLSYFEIPLVAKFRYPAKEHGSMGPFGIFGPVLSINTKATLVRAGFQENFNQNITDVDFGLAVGAGFDFDAGPGVATLDLRWVTGLTDLFKGDAKQLLGSNRNQAMQLTASWVVSLF